MKLKLKDKVVFVTPPGYAGFSDNLLICVITDIYTDGMLKIKTLTKNEDGFYIKFTVPESSVRRLTKVEKVLYE